MRMKVPGALVLAVLTLAMHSSEVEAGNRGKNKRSCIQGVVMASPVVGGAAQSIRMPDGPTSAPLKGAVISVRITSNGKEVARTRTDKNGFYKVWVQPGDFTVVGLPPEPGAALPKGETKTTTVRAGGCTTLNLSYDTGIRF